MNSDTTVRTRHERATQSSTPPGANRSLRIAALRAFLVAGLSVVAGCITGPEGEPVDQLDADMTAFDADATVDSDPLDEPRPDDSGDDAGPDSTHDAESDTEAQDDSDADAHEDDWPRDERGRADGIDTPTFSREVEVSRTIVIDEPGVYDYEGVLHVWTGGGRCNQTENQPYILRISSSHVTLRNFAYQGAPDGIHIGTCDDGQAYDCGEPIEDIRLENVIGWACEDALTTQYGVRDLTIVGSIFLANPDSEYRDKLLQLNFGDVTIEHTVFFGGQAGTCVMFKGDQDVRISESLFIGCERAVNGSTHDGILGHMGTGHSTLLSERNEAYFSAWRLPWDPYEFLTAYGDVSVVSSGDRIFDSGRNSARDGATIDVD